VEGLANADERGGLSGAPLTEKATEIIAALAKALDGALPIIGVGGILSGKDAQEKMEAGAVLVQIYSGLVFRGPGLVGEILDAGAIVKS
jgi:dihydroorotate dehydrogenase